MALLDEIKADISNLGQWVKGLGKGWFVPVRNAISAPLLVAVHSLYGELTSKGSVALLAAVNAAETAAEAVLAANPTASIGDIGVAARNAGEASLAASGQQLEQSLFLEAVRDVLNVLKPGAGDAAVSAS